MISLLLPTRKRPQNLIRLYESVKVTATKDIEFSVYVDDDDQESAEVAQNLNVVVTVGPRVVLSEMWNVACKAASGDIFMHCGDDIIFRTPGWDQIIEKEFDKVPDKILFVHGDDLSGNAHNGGTHGFLHKNWVDVIGYFVPPLFSCDYNDTWLNWVADKIGRRVYVPAVVTEHMHPSFYKAELDETHLERISRGQRDDVVALWESTKPLRELDAYKLSKFLETSL